MYCYMPFHHDCVWLEIRENNDTKLRPRFQGEVKGRQPQAPVASRLYTIESWQLLLKLLLEN